MRETAAAKSARYVLEGRLLIVEVDGDRIGALCRGDGALYNVGYEAGEWRCDCLARSRQCAHLRALRLVTVANPRTLQARRTRKRIEP